MYNRFKNILKQICEMGKMQKRDKNVYIKGCHGRGKEVLNFLAGLGGVNRMRYTGEESGIFYIDGDEIKLVTIYSDLEKYEEIVRGYKRVFLPTVDEGYVVVKQEDIYPTAELASFHLQFNSKYKDGEYVVRKLEMKKR